MGALWWPLPPLLGGFDRVHGHGEVGEGIRRAAAALVGSVGCVGASLAGVEATVVSF